MATRDSTSFGNGTYQSFADSPAAPLAAVLHAEAESTSIVIQGDSTANQTSEWFYTFCEWLAGQFPAFSFWHRLWNDTNQGYDQRTAIQVGSGGDRAISLDGTGDYVSAPDTSGVSVTGDLALVAKVTPTDLTPAAESTIVAKFGASGNRSFRFFLNTGGTLAYDWSADGSTLLGTKFSTAALGSVGYSDGETFWVAVTHDVDNGASGNDIKFWHSADSDGVPASWTQLGSTATTASTTSIFDSTAPVQVGCRGDASPGAFLTGQVHYAEMRAGVDLASSDIRMSMDPATWRSGTTFADAEGNTWTLQGDAAVSGAPAVTVLNASTSGETLDYSTDVTRFGLQTPLLDPLLAVVNYSHNEGSAKVDYASDIDGLCDQLRTKFSYVPIILSTQNPKKSPETAAEIKAHALRNRQIAQVAAAKRFGLIDIFSTANASGSPGDYTTTDGIHPSATGHAAWDEELRKLFRQFI